MLGLLFSMICSLKLSWWVIVTLMCMYLPSLFSFVYKTHNYIEDSVFYSSSLSSMLSLLTISLLLLIILASKESKYPYYIFLQVSLAILLLYCFNTSSLLSFYVLFEVCLIPILLMIVSWGYQPERLQAGFYMILYTVFSSMPLLVIILWLSFKYSTTNMHMLNMLVTSWNKALMLGLIAFLVKLPVYGLHVWLPKAHVEAPLGGSMVLAGVLLKLGGYGLYVYSDMIFFPNVHASLISILVISLWGGFLASMACMMQNDIKAFIAYSSIVHMSVVVLGVLSNTSSGMIAATVIMLSHGWISSLMFLLAYVTYCITGSRSYSYTKGMLSVIPILSLLWFMTSMFNMGFPPTLNFFGEIMVLPSALLYSWQMFMPVAGILFMSVLYNMYLYSQINHSAVSYYLIPGLQMSNRTMLCVLGHFLPTLLVFKLYIMYK